MYCAPHSFICLDYISHSVLASVCPLGDYFTAKNYYFNRTITTFNRHQPSQLNRRYNSQILHKKKADTNHLNILCTVPVFEFVEGCVTQ